MGHVFKIINKHFIPSIFVHKKLLLSQQDTLFVSLGDKYMHFEMFRTSQNCNDRE